MLLTSSVPSFLAVYIVFASSWPCLQSNERINPEKKCHVIVVSFVVWNLPEYDYAVFLSKISPKQDFNVNRAYFFYFMTWISCFICSLLVVFTKIFGKKI